MGSYGERIALADKLADVAMRHQWRATEFARMARKVRTGVDAGVILPRSAV